jgi:DNA-binding response OmpR family regulator
MTDSKKVLAVDDDENTLYLIDSTLSADGYEVIKADNGYTALSKATSENPGLIILDLLLPRLDGVKVVKKLKDNPITNRIPIIITSGNSKKEMVVELIKLGIKNFITKPFDVNELNKKVQELLPLNNPLADATNLTIRYSVNEDILNVKLSGDLTANDTNNIIKAIETHVADNITKVIINLLNINALGHNEIKILEEICSHFENNKVKIKFTAGDQKSLRANLLMNSDLKENLLMY